MDAVNEKHPQGAPPPGWTPPMADIDWVKRKYLDVVYASDSPNQRLDIYLPEKGKALSRRSYTCTAAALPSGTSATTT